MNHPSSLPSLLLCALLGAAACGSVRSSPPPVTPSSPQPATTVVLTGLGQAFTPPCLVVNLGDTVEWRNLSPQSAIDMLSTAAPYEISAPLLLSPYDYVPASQSDQCAQRAADGVTCIEALPFSFWRHTFTRTGAFDYYDASGAASSSTTTTTNEYGMPVGTASTGGAAATGTVCVQSSLTDTECAQVCCLAVANQCAPGVTCISSRCGGVTVGSP